MSSLPTYPVLTCISGPHGGYTRPDIFRISPLGSNRLAGTIGLSCGPRSYKPTPAQHVDAMQRRLIQPSPSVPAIMPLEWQEGARKHRSTRVDGSAHFNIKMGRHACMTQQHGHRTLQQQSQQLGLSRPTTPGQYLYRTPTQLLGSGQFVRSQSTGILETMSRSSTAPSLVLDQRLGRPKSPRTIMTTTKPTYKWAAL